MINIRNSSLIACLILCCLGCNNQIQQPDQEENPVTSQAAEKDPYHSEWAYLYSVQSDSLQFLYDQQAIKILENGEVIAGNEQIKNHLFSLPLQVSSAKTDTVITAHKERAIEYGIVENVYQNGGKSKSIVIWQTKNEERKRVLEFTSKVAATDHSLSDLDNRRALWIGLCNKHNAKDLIDELYTKNTLYYNHKPLIKGRASLIGEYGYMNNESYSLSLEPMIVDKVNGNFIYEIGQCSGSYNGKYLLVWHKDEDGKWRIFIDSNI